MMTMIFGDDHDHDYKAVMKLITKLLATAMVMFCLAMFIMITLLALARSCQLRLRELRIFLSSFACKPDINIRLAVFL